MKIPKLKRFAFTIAVILVINTISPSSVLCRGWGMVNQIRAEEVIESKEPGGEEPGGEEPGGEEPGGEEPGGEEPGGETPGGEEPGGEEPGGEEPGGEEPGGEEPGGEEPGGEEPGGETPGGEEPGGEEPGGEEPGGEEPGSEEPGGEEPGGETPGGEEPGGEEPGGETSGGGTPGGSGEDIGIRVLLINYLIDLVAYYPYSSEQREAFLIHLENKFNEMDDEAMQAFYDKYYMVDEEAGILIQGIMTMLSVNGGELQKDSLKDTLLELLIGDGLDDSNLQHMVESYINGNMTDEEAEEIYMNIIEGWLSVDDSIWYIARLTYPAVQNDIYPLFLDLNAVPEPLVNELNKKASPIDEAFREYEVSLSFKVGEQVITEDGTLADIERYGFKVTGNTPILNEADFPKGNGKCFGLYLAPGKDYYIQNVLGEYEKIIPNIYWDGSDGDRYGYPTNTGNCYIFVPDEEHPANVWIYAWDGTTFNDNLNDTRGEETLYTSLPFDTTYNTINNVFITETIPAGFRYIEGSAKIDGGYDDIDAFENTDGTITIALYGEYSNKNSPSAEPYTITYQIAASQSAYPAGRKSFELDYATMDYDIEYRASSVISNICDIDVPPLFKAVLSIDKPVIWECSSVILTPDIIVLGTNPPTGSSQNDWNIPDRWLDYYDFGNYVKILTDDKDNEIELENLNEILLANVAGTGTKTYTFTAKMPTEKYPYYTAHATAEITVFKGELTIEMVVDSGTERPVTKGVFDVLVRYEETETNSAGQFSFGADLGKSGNRDSRTYTIRHNTIFNVSAYVPYGYQVADVENSGAKFILDDTLSGKTHPTYTITQTITVKIIKTSKPWFRDWAWKREDDDIYDSEVMLR